LWTLVLLLFLWQLLIPWLLLLLLSFLYIEKGDLGSQTEPKMDVRDGNLLELGEDEGQQDVYGG
jgi:hypothetical protein